MKSSMGAKDPSYMPKTATSKGGGVASPTHTSVTGAAKIGKGVPMKAGPAMSMKAGPRSASSKR